MPCNYADYPPNWKTEIRPAILKRAKNRCEDCGVENGAIGMRDKSGKFSRLEGEGENLAALIDGDKIIRIVLTVSHTDHDLKNNDYKNLKALCQQCHNRHDVDHRRRTRKYKGDETGDLFK